VNIIELLLSLWNNSIVFAYIIIDFLTVIEAQRTLYAARDQFSQYKLARLQALVSLCKALGGGWQAPEGAAQPQAAGLQHF